jgi:hypothetical protein
MSNSGHRSLTPSTCAPPCGIQPFLGFCSYLCPLCYLYNDSSALYSLARSFYCRLWCRLNVISGDENCLLRICASFESLLLQSDLRLYLHLLKINLQPLHVQFVPAVASFLAVPHLFHLQSIALPWLQLGFVGYLEIDQVLILWDRLLGPSMISRYSFPLTLLMIRRNNGSYSPCDLSGCHLCLSLTRFAPGGVIVTLPPFSPHCSSLPSHRSV